MAQNAPPKSSPQDPLAPEAPPPPSLRTVLVLLFVSGFASLVYQVLWMRELSLLLGSTAYATAGTLAVFFGGLAIGGAIWSRRAPRTARPLAEYGVLELGVGLSGGLYFGLMHAYSAVYTPLHAALGENPTLLLVAKMVLAAGALLPPATLMGGTLPLMCQHVVGTQGARGRAGSLDRAGSLGRVGTLLYGVNTLGAATGALAAGFWLPAWIGFHGAYLVAIIASLIIGGVAYGWGRKLARQDTFARGDAPSAGQGKRRKKTRARPETVPLTAPKLVAAALGSGAFALSLEVLWTRMFQQVLQNSVYTFSIILVTFLTALAVGAFLARGVARTGIAPWNALAGLLTCAGVGALVTPFLFYGYTDGMRYLGAGEQWSVYLGSITGAAFLVLFLPGVAAGSVFPYLLRVAERSGEAGRVVGWLSAINTAGAIVGSLVTGFALLGLLGLWSSLRLVAVLYFLLAVWIATGSSRRAMVVPAVGLVLAFTVADPSSLPGVRLNTETERLLGSWEGRDGFVAVIERRGSRRIKINNFYALGGSASVEHEQNQTLIPLMSHPNPERLFYLGMGTGITAGAALRLPAQEITVTELVPEVITAAATFFDEESFGLFTNPRARVLARDGRNELRGNDATYDAIVADLFLPWRAGVGNLYSRDHYAKALQRLRPGGVYVQWIPLYQVTDVEYWTIVRTFLDVFPEVQVWRGDFYAGKPILALVGSAEATPLSLEAIARNGRFLRGGAAIDPTAFLAVTLPFYAGNLGESRGIVPPGPIHTDDRPIIDYQAPISHRNARAGRADWFIGPQLIDFMRQLLAATPPEDDPYLSALDPATRGYVAAGLSYHTSAVLEDLGRRDEARQYRDAFVAQLPIPIEFQTRGSASSVVEESSDPGN